MTDMLIFASLVVARTKCNNDTTEPAGCGEKWCKARGEVRKALDFMGIVWKEEPAEEPKAADA
jgi:hypothetical protein